MMEPQGKHYAFCGCVFLAAAGLSVNRGSAAWGADTQPASAPAIAESPPKAALQAFIQAVLAGDEKKYRDLLVFGNDQSRQTAQVLLSQAAARQKLQRAVREVFGDAARDFSAGMNEQELATAQRGLAAATVETQVDEARIRFAEGPVYVMRKVGGQWKLDFDRTQAAMGTLMPAAQVDVIRKQNAEIDQLTKDVALRKYISLEQVEEQMSRIDMMMAAILKPPVPATTRP
jgi:hypothetical protein